MRGSGCVYGTVVFEEFGGCVHAFLRACVRACLFVGKR